MRIRHAGLLNRYWPVSDVAEFLQEDHPSYLLGLTRGMALLWVWRVKQWRWSGSLAWDIGSGAEAGSFSGVVMDATGALEFPGLDQEGHPILQEMNLLHRKDFVMSASSDTSGSVSGDLGFIGISLTIGEIFGMGRYLHNGPMDYTTRFLVPTVSLGIAGNFGTVINPDNIEFGTDAAGPLYLRQTFDSAPDFSGVIQCEPHTWYPYKDAGGNPVWDEATGAQLADPRGDN